MGSARPKNSHEAYMQTHRKGGGKIRSLLGISNFGKKYFANI
jgi:hypothetical protein